MMRIVYDFFCMMRAAHATEIACDMYSHEPKLDYLNQRQKIVTYTSGNFMWELTG